MTEIALDDEPFGFCDWVSKPDGPVAVDLPYISHLRGVGGVDQLVAVDTYTRWARGWLVHGLVGKDASVKFFKRIWTTSNKLRTQIEAFVSDDGPDYKATTFADTLAATAVGCYCCSSNVGEELATLSFTMLSARKYP